MYVLYQNNLCIGICIYNKLNHRDISATKVAILKLIINTGYKQFTNSYTERDRHYPAPGHGALSQATPPSPPIPL